MQGRVLSEDQLVAYGVMRRIVSVSWSCYNDSPCFQCGSREGVQYLGYGEKGFFLCRDCRISVATTLFNSCRE